MENDSISANQVDFFTNKINSLLEEINEYYAALERMVRIRLKMAEDDKDYIRETREILKKGNDRLSEQIKSELRQYLLESRMGAFLIEVICPLYSVMHYIGLYRFPQLTIHEIASLDSVPNSRVSTDDFFYILTNLPRKISSVIIDNIPCSIHDKKLLYQYLINNDKESFINLIYLKDLDITNISKVCSIYSNDILINTILSTSLDEEKLTVLKELPISCDQNDFFEEYFPALFQLRDCIRRDEYADLEPFTLAFKEAMQLYLACKKYYTLKEQDIIEKIIKNPEYTDICNNVFNELKLESWANKSVEVKDISSDSDCNKEFTLPDDYFNRDPIENNNIYFCRLQSYVKERGCKVFMEFINYLAENDYIENTIAVKEKLAFHLTGIILSDSSMERIKKIERIEWKQEARYLFYIISHFYKKWDYKSDRMKEVFYCKDPKFEKNISSFSSYATRGGLNTKDPFLIKIRNLYPKIEALKQ
ncbi:hypothetical protein [Bacteroides thetaiotaomicron]|uniref:hypothetical protein n=1 Tax=Bacteroides thetaiotaomicron TaxID=818 RepID=UPI000E509970|nr:hypothetical protein [Bacteroides thetaiotaomicron]RGR96934.1 hypothetical protein DWY18_01035 [Bacteroides thetaiotaomicron]